MKEVKITVEYDGENVLVTNSPAQAFFYSNMREYNELSHKDAVVAASVALEMYIKDDDGTPLGKLSDYVGKHFARLDVMSSVRDMLDDFYDNYQTDDLYEYDNEKGDEH